MIALLLSIKQSRLAKSGQMQQNTMFSLGYLEGQERNHGAHDVTMHVLKELDQLKVLLGLAGNRAANRHVVAIIVPAMARTSATRNKQATEHRAAHALCGGVQGHVATQLDGQQHERRGEGRVAAVLDVVLLGDVADSLQLGPGQRIRTQRRPAYHQNVTVGQITVP